MGPMLADIRFGLRGLRRNPGFAVAAILTLALGLGTTTAMYAVVQGVVLKPLPFPDADRLITLCEQYPGSTSDWCSISPPNVEDIAARSRAIEAVGIGRTWSYHLATPEGLRNINAGIVTPGLFAALGVRPLAGRLLEPSDLIGGPSSVAVLSYETWQSRYGGDQDVIGRTITLDGVAVTVVGIVPPGFVLPRFPPVALWRPIHLMPTDEHARDWRGFVAYARVRRGVTLAAARSDVDAIASELKTKHFAATDRWSISVQSLQDLVVSRVRPAMLLFLGAVVLVLLIGCANVANLLLVRANARAREIAIRVALGAGRARVARALFVESLLLALGGAGVGLLFAVGGIKAFKLMAPAGIPRVDEVAISGSVLMFALLAAGATAAIFGLLPAVRATRSDVAQALREGGRGSSGSVGRLGAWLVVAELAMAVTLVAGAGLLARTFAAYSAWSPGFEREHLLMFTVSAPEPKYAGAPQIAALWDRLENELAALPGVTGVATASAGPLVGGGDGSAAVSFGDRASSAGATAAWFDVSPSWFPAIGLPIVRGRNLAASDAYGGPRVALVNETFASRYWPSDNAIGQKFTMLDRGMPLTIVGVVRDVAPLMPGDVPGPQVYWSNRQLPRPYTWVMVRTSAAPSSLADAIRKRVAFVDPDIVPGTMQNYSDIVAAQLRRPRFTMTLVAVFGAAALLLASVGVYGLMAYMVSMRRREIGIRLALGAQRRQVLGEFMGWGVRVAGVGIMVGGVTAIALGRVLESQIPGVSPRDPLTLAGSAALLLLVTLAACAFPARRASRVDPASVLGAE